MTIRQAVDLARQQHEAGHLPEAESLYKQILEADPNQPDAIHMLGVLAFQTGRADVALRLIQRALSVAPESPQAFANLGRVLSSLGRRDEAITAYRKSLQLDGGGAEVHNNLANLLLREGLVDDAITHYRQAIASQWDFAEAYSNLGSVLRGQGQLEEAITSLRCAIRLKPQLADAHYNLGLALRQLDQLCEAINAFRAALDCRPSFPEAWNNLGSVMEEHGDYKQAIDAFRHALALRPAFPEALTNLANVMRDTGQLEESITLARQALAAKPGYATAHNSLGSSLHSSGQFDQAIESYQRAIELRPDWDVPRCNLGFTLLLKGDFERGWREHEWRRRCSKLSDRQDFTQPVWDGSDLSGKTILLHTEQGFGDAIQFCRYAPLVAQRGGRVIIRCQPELVCLMKGLCGVEQVVSAEESSLPAFDVQCPLLSLPLVFKTNSISEIPKNVPYLRAHPPMMQKWHERLADHQSRLKIGLVWSGRAQPPGRSIPLPMLAPLAQAPGTTFISLQFGDPARQASTKPPAGMQILNWSDELRSFADTASLLANIDLLVTIDTSTAHLAGAMGKPVWVMLPAVPDWRWMLDRSDSPWYPTMRLFRQSRAGDWSGPVEQLAAALRSFTAGA
jgi:tetratricopeptide (TPR) repeat protein